MADTKISGLTANTAPLSTDITVIIDDPAGSPLSQKITLANLMALFANPVSDGGDNLGTAALRWGLLYLASGGVINFNNGNVTITHSAANLTIAGGNLNLAAGTTTLAPLKFSQGSNLTTAEDGAIEMDAACFYACTDAGNRGIIPVKHMIRSNATRTFANDTAQQAIWDDPTNGTLTLEDGTYLFEGQIAMTGMSSTSGNGKFSIIGAGTATLGDILWQAYGNDVAAEGTAAATGGGWHVIATQTAANIVTAGAATALCFLVKGTFTVTAGGTIIPSFAQTTAAAAVVSIGSYFTCHRIGSTAVVSVGQWT